MASWSSNLEQLPEAAAWTSNLEQLPGPAAWGNNLKQHPQAPPTSPGIPDARGLTDSNLTVSLFSQSRFLADHNKACAVRQRNLLAALVHYDNPTLQRLCVALLQIVA